jgi:phosphoglycerol transferase MdoB-like AlkP superfamily enzyme
MPFLFWNSTLEKPIKVTKYGSSLDVLPTILNLFGIDYDSRLLMGTDILSNSEGLVIFSNRSFITKEGQFNSITKKFTGNQVADDYVENINFEIFNKYKYSRLVLEKDYYRKLYTELGWIK